MPTTIRSYLNDFEIQNRSDNMMKLPTKWELMTQIGIFNNKEFLTQNSFVIEEIDQSRGIMTDTPFNVRKRVGSDSLRRKYTFSVPSFGAEDAIVPQDIIGKQAFGSELEETLAGVRARKFQFIRDTIAETWEKAALHTLITGTNYAPSGTVQVDWYANFGKTRKVFKNDLSNATLNLNNILEDVIAQMQDAVTDGQIPSNWVAVCSPEYFTALVNHPSVEKYWVEYQQKNWLLGARVIDGPLALDQRYRQFEFCGILFVEYRGKYFTGERMIEAGKAILFPRDGGDNFRIAYAPAQRFDTIGQVARESYLFESADMDAQVLKLQYETNFLHVLRQPNLVATLDMAAP